MPGAEYMRENVVGDGVERYCVGPLGNALKGCEQEIT